MLRRYSSNPFSLMREKKKTEKSHDFNSTVHGIDIFFFFFLSGTVHNNIQTENFFAGK